MHTHIYIYIYIYRICTSCREREANVYADVHNICLAYFIFNCRVDIYTPSSTVKDGDYRVVEIRILKCGVHYQPKLIINIICRR